MMKRHGFTLIELLVVIAIIAILAAILFPVFAQAREKARQTQCLSNSKQIGTAIMMYGQDYDETYIPWFVLTGLPSNQYRDDLRSWVQNLQPYIKSGEPSRPAGSGPFASVPPRNDGLSLVQRVAVPAGSEPSRLRCGRAGQQLVATPTLSRELWNRIRRNRNRGQLHPAGSLLQIRRERCPRFDHAV